MTSLEWLAQTKPLRWRNLQHRLLTSPQICTNLLLSLLTGPIVGNDVGNILLKAVDNQLSLTLHIMEDKIEDP